MVVIVVVIVVVPVVIVVVPVVVVVVLVIVVVVVDLHASTQPNEAHRSTYASPEETPQTECHGHIMRTM